MPAWVLSLAVLAGVAIYAIGLTRSRTREPKANLLESLVDQSSEPLPPRYHRRDAA